MFGLFERIKSSEYNELARRMADLDRKIHMLDMDISLLTDKLGKAIARKSVKKETVEESKDIKEPSILIGLSGQPYGHT